jgi:hypothetical protein
VPFAPRLAKNGIDAPVAALSIIVLEIVKWHIGKPYTRRNASLVEVFSALLREWRLGFTWRYRVFSNRLL